jgi:hypothetical protein
MMSAPSRFAVSRIFCRRHHHAEIDHLVIVALQHDADDVLADVVHVALDGGQHDLAGGGRVPRRPLRAFSSSMNGIR